MLALATYRDLEIMQFDVKTAFLHGVLEEEVFMKIPEGLSDFCNVNNNKSDLVCKLNKSLYGLKQASRCWRNTFKTYLSVYNFTCCDAESSIFVGRMKGIVVYILLFVDDGLIITKDCNVLNDVLKILENRFEITVCELNIFVGIRVVRERAKNIMILHQTDYSYKVLKRFYILDAKPVCTPIEKGIDINLMKAHDPDCEKLPYRVLIGSLMFLSTVSRPDIVYAVNFLTRFLDSFTRSHWEAAKRILKYIKGTANREIMYRNSGSVLELVGYCDSDYAGDRGTRRSTSRFCI